MNTNNISTISSNSFFEAVLSKRASEQKITQDKVTSILENGNDGIIQFAEHFEKVNTYRGLENGMNRMISLISLYLENRSKGDLNIALEIFLNTDILELSRRGSSMIKELIQIKKSIGDIMDDKYYYNIFSNPNNTLYLKYNSLLEDSKNKLRLYLFYKELLKNFKLKSKIDIKDEYNSEENIFILFSYIASGKTVESEQLSYFITKGGNKQKWEAFLDTIDDSFQKFKDIYTFEFCLKYYIEQNSKGRVKSFLENEELLEKWEELSLITNQDRLTGAINVFFFQDFNTQISLFKLNEFLQKVSQDKNLFDDFRGFLLELPDTTIIVDYISKFELEEKINYPISNKDLKFYKEILNIKK